jgi:hypothetical protein
MNVLAKVIIVITVACAVIGCTPPIGNIGGSGSDINADSDGLTAVPKRTTYTIPNQKFQRDYDLNVFVSYRGVLYTIPIDAVEISVIEDPDNKPDIKNLVFPTEIYPFESKGLKMILVEYNNLSDTYYVDVLDPDDMGGGSGGGEDVPGIEVKWL